MNEIHLKLGEVLKLEREARKIAIEDVSDQLKISVENLTYVEEGRINDAPSELYFGLFAKSYAEYLGIDYSRTMEAIKAEFGELEPELKSGGSKGEATEESDEEAADDDEEKPSKASNKKMFGWIGIGLMVVIIALLVWIIAFGGGMDSLQGNKTEEGQQAGEPSQQAQSIVDNYEFGTPPTDAPAPIKFRMVAAEECWSTVIADGDTVIFRNLIPGRQYDVEAQYRLLISIAHPRVVTTWLNGTQVNLRDPQTRRISRVEVTQINLDEMMAPRAEPEPEVSTPAVVPPRPATQPVNSTPAATPPPSTTEPAEVDSSTQDTAGGL